MNINKHNHAIKTNNIFRLNLIIVANGKFEKNNYYEKIMKSIKKTARMFHKVVFASFKLIEKELLILITECTSQTLSFFIRHGINVFLKSKLNLGLYVHPSQLALFNNLGIL